MEWTRTKRVSARVRLRSSFRFISFRSILCTRTLLLTGIAVGSVSNVTRKEHFGSLFAAVFLREDVGSSGLESNGDGSLQVAAHAGVNEDIVQAIGPSEDNGVSDAGLVCCGALVGDNPAEDFDGFLGRGEGGQDEEGQDGKD